jgi:putative hemolysin
VGSIEDEFDDEKPCIIKLGTDTFEIAAECLKEKVTKKCKLKLPESSADTIGGVVTELMEKIPKVGDKIVIGKYEISIIAAEPTRIIRLMLKKAEKDSLEIKATT